MILSVNSFSTRSSRTTRTSAATRHKVKRLRQCTLELYILPGNQLVVFQDKLLGLLSPIRLLQRNEQSVPFDRLNRRGNRRSRSLHCSRTGKRCCSACSLGQ